jgi:hypothetical protein
VQDDKKAEIEQGGSGKTELFSEAKSSESVRIWISGFSPRIQPEKEHPRLLDAKDFYQRECK